MLQTPNAEKSPINIVGSSIFGRYSKISSEITMNMFISDNWLINFAGYKRVLELLAAGEGRGLFHSIRGNILVAVVNSQVYRIDQNFFVTMIGPIATTSGEVFMDENLNSQICIVDGVNAYIYNHSLPPNITLQSLGVPLVPNYVCYHNTFFLIGNNLKTSDGSKWYAFQFEDDTHIETAPTNEFTIQTKPDYALAVVRLPGQGNNVLVMGTSVCEIFTQIGGLQNYRRNSTANIDYGCLSVSTIATSDQYVAWLAVNENNAPTIMVFTGQGYAPISTDGIDYLMSQLQHPERSTAMFYRQDGHLFYQLTFYAPEDNLTLAYDFSNQKFFNLSDSSLNYHPARNMVYFNNSTYFISLNNASLYLCNTDQVVNNENIDTNDPSLIHNIQRIRIPASIRKDDSERFVANSLVITIEQGCDPNVTGLSIRRPVYNMITEDDFTPPNVPIITEDGAQIVGQNSWAGKRDTYNNIPPYIPRVDISISRDGGVTWGNTVGQNLHVQGWRKNMLTWNKLGAANDLTFKFRFWGMSRFIVNDGVLEVY